MFNFLRKLLSFWGAADANVSENSNDTWTKVTPESSGAITQVADDRSTSGPAYRAAFNHATPPPQYAKKVFRTPSSPIRPNSALSGYFFSRVKDTGAATSHISNIPPPQVPLFGSQTVNDNRHSSWDTPIESDDIDMLDANTQLPQTPPITPPGRDGTQRVSNESSQRNERSSTAEDDSTENSPNSAVPHTYVERDDRPQLQPKRQQDRLRRPTTPLPRTNWVDEIVIEEDTLENNLPVGYLGTFRGSRHFVPDYSGMLPCSYNYKHLLLCGHWIDSSETCGSNCKKQDHNQKPFNCPTCRDIVHEILNGSFTAAESTRLRKLREKHDRAFLACCVEQVTRTAPQLKCGVTEAVSGFLLTDYGRSCERTENPDPEGRDSIEWLVRDMQERHERKQREKFARGDPLNKHDKRKSYEEALKMSAKAGSCANNASAAQKQRSGSSTMNDEMQGVSPATNKKQKVKLESHGKPIIPQNRGTKRSSSLSSSSSSSSDSANASIFASTPGAKPLHAPTKKVYIPPSPNFGEISFLTPPPHVVGAIWRKRRNQVNVDVDVDMKGEGKKMRMGSWRGEL